MLGGCGGGGGNDGSPATLDGGNAVVVAAEVLQSMRALGDLGAGAGGLVTLADAPGGIGAMRLQSLARRSVRQLQPALAVDPVTEPCLAGGSIRLAGTVASPGTLGTGDSVTLTFTDCDDGDGAAVSGRLRLVVLQYAGDLLSDRFRLRADATFTSLRVTTGDGTFGADGRARLELDTLAVPATSAISGARLTVTSGTGRRTLSDFAVDTAVVPLPVPATTRLSGTGTLGSTGFAGTVVFVTLFPLQAAGTDRPHSGEVEILGAGDARLRVIIRDRENVEVYLDRDGNGSTDEVIATSWLALAAAVSPAGFPAAVPAMPAAY